MHCTAVPPALVRTRTCTLAAASAPRPSRPSHPEQSAIYRRRLTIQTPLQGHRVVAPRLSKIP